MNCQAHFHRGQDPKHISRRWFFRDCGVGLGSIALAQLLGEALVREELAGEAEPASPHGAPAVAASA